METFEEYMKSARALLNKMEPESPTLAKRVDEFLREDVEWHRKAWEAFNSLPEPKIRRPRSKNPPQR